MQEAPAEARSKGAEGIDCSKGLAREAVVHLHASRVRLMFHRHGPPAQDRQDHPR